MVAAVRPYYFKEWVHEHVKRPYLEGIERLQRAWHGVDFHSIYNPRLSKKERIFSLLIGLILLIPFFNAVVWKGWETFGKPEILSSTFNPGIEIPPVDVEPHPVEQHQEPEPPPPAPAAAPPPPPAPALPPIGAALQVEEFQDTETEPGKPPIHSSWKISTYPDLIIVNKQSTIEGTGTLHENVTATYNPQWVLQEYNLVSGDGQTTFHAKLHGKKIHLLVNAQGRHADKELPLKERYPWVQQATFGLRKFASNVRERTTDFYGISPLDLSLTHIVAKKKGEEDVRPFGRLVKIELSLTGIKSLAWKGVIWADPQSGQARKITSHFITKPLTMILATLNHP